MDYDMITRLVALIRRLIRAQESDDDYLDRQW